MDNILNSKTTVWICIMLCSLFQIPANLMAGSIVAFVFLGLAILSILIAIGIFIYQLVSWKRWH